MRTSSRVPAVLATTAVAGLLLAGCGSNDAKTASSSTSAAKLGKVVYIPGLTGNPFYNTVSCGAKTKAKELGVDYSYQGSSTFDVAEQTKIVNAVVATKPGAT